MDLVKDVVMDLVTLLAKCPTLLDACVGGRIIVFRCMRLISKEARKVVLNTSVDMW